MYKYLLINFINGLPQGEEAGLDWEGDDGV